MTEPQPGDIGLVRVAGVVGWAITIGELIYDGNWRQSHAFLYLGDGRVLEAQPGGARIAPLSEYNGRSVECSTRQPSAEERQSIVAIGESLVGVPYGWLDYASLALWRFRIRLPAIRHRVNDGSNMICSQLVDYAWAGAGVHIFEDGREPGDVTPGDLARQMHHGGL